MIDWSTQLAPSQQFGAAWLRDRAGAYLADDPGYGKTRQALAACEDQPFVTVVCPAAIRDARVWQDEAERIGFDVPVTTMSYHELAKRPVRAGGAVIFDEAHRVKSRKVSWADNAKAAADTSNRTYLLSGTPVPNGYLPELYGQMRLINPEIPDAFWKNKDGTGWVERWFVTVHGKYSDWEVPGTLLACRPDMGCFNPGVTDCVHRRQFWDANVGDLMLRRSEEDLGLPDLLGADQPMATPMTPTQRRVYTELKKDLLAQIPEEGITLEALTTSEQYSMMFRCTTSVSAVHGDPSADRHSGKLALLAETLPDATHPAVVACYYRESANAVIRTCEKLGLTYVVFGAATPAAARAEAVRRFQAGDAAVLVGSLMTIREGLTLTAADQVVMLERSWTPGDNDQTIRRVRRRGQDKPVVARQFVTPKSFDATQWSVLQDKTANIRASLSRAEILGLFA